MGDIRHTIKGFLKNHAAAITAGFLMTAAVAAGLLQAGTTSVSAENVSIGQGGKSGGVSYKKGNCPVSAIGPEISVTPWIYDYGKLINTDANGEKYEGKSIETYDQKKKVAKEEGSGHGWDVHGDPTKKTEDKLLYIANNTRHNMVSATISNREDHYSEGSLIFVPVGTGKGFGNHHAYTQKVDDGTAKSKSDVSKKHLIFGSVDDGIEGFIGGIPVKGNADSQRDYNKDHVIQQKVIGEKSNGVFMHLIRDMEKENAKKDESKLNYTDKDGEKHYYEDQASDMLYISEHLDSLLDSVRKDKNGYKKAVKLFALATNVYKTGGGSLYTVPETLKDYTDFVTYNSVKKYDGKANDLKLIRSGDTMHVMKKPYGNVKTEEDMYKHIMSEKDISSRLFNNQFSSNSDSIVAQYMQGEYNMAYLDMLLCGYSVSSHKMGKRSEAVKAWKKAIEAYVGGVNNDKYKGQVVVLKLDVGVMSETKKGTFYHTSNGSMAKKVFGLGPSAGLSEKSAKVNKKTMVKSFIGVQTKGNADKYLVFNGNDYIKKYQKAIDLGNIFSRIKAASKANHKNGKVHTSFSSYSNGIANRLFDMEKAGSKAYDTTVKGKPGSEDWIKLLHNGLVGFKGLDSGPYNYGTYAIISMSWWNNNPPVTNPADYELRIYSTKAHATKDGAALSDNNKPDTGAIPENETNGRSIHDTAEYAEITATKPGKQQLTDVIHLKVDSLNVDSDFKKLVDKGDAKVTVEYYANKAGDGTEKANAETRAEEKPAVLKNGSDKDSQKYQDTNAEKYCSDKSRYSFKGIDINMKSDPDATGVRVSDAKECYYENGNGVTPDKDKIESTSKYYDKNEPEWSDCDGYKNLVWQTGFNEMESKGFTYDVPKDEQKWEHYYRVCVVAKVTIRDKKGDYYYKTTDDKPDKDKSVIYTNPVYVTYKISRKVGNPKFEFYGNSGAIDNSESVKAHAYSEFKEGSVYNETFEAMAGVPSTRTMYFATGGEEFMVNLQAVYDDYVAKKGSTVGEQGENVDPDAYKAVRKYTVHFNGVDCEYKAGDTFKGLASGASSTEKFAADSSDNKDGSSAVREVNNAPQPEGATSGNTDAHTNDHEQVTDYAVTWEGEISNNTPRPDNNFSAFQPGTPGSPCAGNGTDDGNGDSRHMSNASTNWDVSDYNTALKNATDWAKEMEKIGASRTGTTWRWDDSDGYERVYHCGTAVVKVQLSGGAQAHSQENCGASPNLGAKSGTYGSDCYSSEKLESNEKAVLGSGWSWDHGKNGVHSGYVAGCGHYCHKQWDVAPSKDSPGVAHSHTHECGSFTPGVNATDGASSSIHYTITVSWKDGTITASNRDGNQSNVNIQTRTGLTKIAAHAMCGACCEHVLPAIEDTWTQKVRYDTVRFSALQVWKLDDGYAGDTESSSGEMHTLKHKTDGNGSGIEDYGSGTYSVDGDNVPGNGDESVRPITGDESEYVRSKIVRYDPNIFYNVATSETSKAGRLRYSLQRGQDDDVYYEEMGDPQRSEGQTRDNLCDGQIDAGEGMSNHSASPITVTKKGHKITFSKGCLYSNSTYSNDMHHDDNPKKSTVKYANWNDEIDPNKSTVGPVAKTKEAYSSNTADEIDKQSTEWKRFEARRAQPNEVSVISDFLILQTSSGDQSIFYYNNNNKTLKTTRCDENFPDDFWYSKPAAQKYIQKSGGGRWYVENTPAAKAAWADMWENNPLRLDSNIQHVYIGGYNGRYSDVNNKYKGEGNGAVVKTDFDDDEKYFNGAYSDEMKRTNGDGFSSRDGRICPAADIYNSTAKAVHSRTDESKASQTADQRNCNSDVDILYGYNDGYISSPGCGNLYPDGKSLDTAAEGSARATRNTYDFYKAPTKTSAWGSQTHTENGQSVRWDKRIPDPGTANFGNAGLVLLQDGIALNPTIANTLYNTGLSYAFYKPIIVYQNKEADNSDMVQSCYSTPDRTGINYSVEELHSAVNGYEFHEHNEVDQYLNKSGVTIGSRYCDGQTKVNNIIIHDPVSVQYSKVIGANESYDQRIYGDDKSNAKTINEENASEEKCPGTAEDCIFRIKNCKFAQRIRRAAFDIDHATRQLYDPDDDSSGTYDTIDSTVMTTDGTYPSVDLTNSGFALAMDNGSTYTGTETEDGDGNITDYSAKHLTGNRGASLMFGWEQLGVDASKTSERYEIGGDFTFSGSGEDALFATDATTVKRLSDGRIQVVTNNGTYTSSETVGSGKHEICYRFAFDSVLFKDASVKVGDKTYHLEANTGVKVDGKDLTFSGPANKGSRFYVSNAGSGVYIGNAPGADLDVSYSLDNIRIDRLPGSTGHTAGCFTVGQEVHEQTRQDYYNGTGTLSSDKIDWTAEHNDGSMTQISVNNRHTHTKECLATATDAFKLAVREASEGKTRDLEKMLGEKVWNKVKDHLEECYGDDGEGATIKKGQTNTYSYSGKTEKVTLLPGTYQITAYGAKGGNESQTGGNGGSAQGTYTVPKATTVYIAAGGKGADSATGSGGGYNGGGNAGASGSSGGGGGASSVSLADGTLRHVVSADRSKVLLVAGGGGGAGNAQTAQTTRRNSGYVQYGAERATNAIHTFTAQASGTVYFWSQDCNNDPWGTIKIYRNGSLVDTVQNDDGGQGTDPDGRPFGPNSRGSYYNFNMSVNFQQGDYVELWVGSYSTSYSNNYCTWHYKYSGTRTVNGNGGTGGGLAGGDAEGMDRNAYGGSSDHASYLGYGGDCRAADGGGGGGGYYGGYGAESDTGAGGGSGHVNYGLLTETSMSNGVNSGNGYVTIKCISLKAYSSSAVLKLVKKVIDNDFGGHVSDIPSTVTTDGHTIINPIWDCEGKFDKHVCTKNCKTLENGKVDLLLDCNEPHHTGGHYSGGDAMCYDPCNDDAKHKAAAAANVQKDRNGKPVNGNNSADDSGFIRLDNYFTVYYPCLGDFADTNDHGIAWCTQSRGIGYVNQMDTTEWTREKWIRFPYSTLYYRESVGKWEEHEADEWYQVDIGYYDADGTYHGYDYYKFYCQLRNREISSGKVEFMVEAINDKGPDESPYGYETPYGRDDIFSQDCPESNEWMTNRQRFSGEDRADATSTTLDAYHSVYKYYYIDVVGRIGNLLFEDTTDWRFSNFFKQAKKPLKWNRDGIAYEVDKAKQNMYYSWHLNNDDTSEDIRTQKVTPNIQWYNTYNTAKWTDVGNNFYKSAPTPLEAWKNYTHQDTYYQRTYGKSVSASLEQDHLKFGYDLLWDISTIGNYGDGNLQIEPKYYAYDTWTRKIIPVDVHMSDGEDTKTINYFGLMDEYGTKRYDEYSAKLFRYNMNLDWKHEQAERNAVGDEWEHTLAVSEAYVHYLYDANGNMITKGDADGMSEPVMENLGIPHGENYSLGDIQFQYLDRDRTATFFGNSTVPALKSYTYDHTDRYTETLNDGINGGIDQELWHNYGVLGAEGEPNDVKGTDYYERGQRWHTRLGLPSSARFTDASDKNGDGLPDHLSPDSVTEDENGNTIREWEKFDNDRIEQETGKRRYLFLETATITAIGDPWDLRYDQKKDNGHITVGSKYTGGGSYDVYFEQTSGNGIWDFPTLLAVYDSGEDDSDYRTLQTH